MRTLLVKVVLGWVLALLVGLAAAWLWSASHTSLAGALTLLQTLLPAGHSLQADGVKGSLRQGGQIALLRWRHNGLTLEAHTLRIGWSLPALWQPAWRVSELSMAELTVKDQRPPTDTQPSVALTQLVLPLRLEVPFKIQRFSVQGSTTAQATELSGIYTFDSNLHKISQGYGQFSSGKYQLDAELQAAAPMALVAHLSGQVQSSLPGSSQPITAAAQAQLSGQLSGPQAQLVLQAQLVPALQAQGHAPAMQAHLTAQLAPWQAQPLTQAQAQWQALDVAALWPQAPHTLLSGQVIVSPQGAGWVGSMTLTNALPGPWNQQRLPLQSLQTAFSHQDHRWGITALKAMAAGGHISGNGQFTAATWQGSASLAGLDPAALDTRLSSSVLGGTLQAQSVGAGLGFTLQLTGQPGPHQPQPPARQAPPVARPAPAVLPALQSLQAQGQWGHDVLTLNTLHISTTEAQLGGELVLNTHTLATQGKLKVQLPGLQGVLNGHISASQGEGQINLTLSDASLASRWLQRLTPVTTPLQALPLTGQASLQAQWQGGWQQLGQDLHLQASLQVPQLQWRSPAASGVSPSTAHQLQQVQINVTGTLSALLLTSQGKLDTGGRQLHWQTQASAGQVQPGHWQGTLNTLQLKAQDLARPGWWTLALADEASAMAAPLSWDWQRTDTLQRVSLGNGQAVLTGPAPGRARLSWQTQQWEQVHSSAPQSNPNIHAAPRWQSQGHITQLPLAWLDAISGTTLADLGLASDVLLAGSWNARYADSLNLIVQVERSTGDVRLQTDTKTQPTIPAQLQEVSLTLQLLDQQLAASLRWHSAQAGQALLAFSTELQHLESGWGWSPEAPVAASLQMQLPTMDVWSVLAPPGWRLRGTLDAFANLTGTRRQPQWTGHIQAHNLALRALVDGIDFQQGSLTARLHGQQLQLEDFTLHGAGSSGGQVSMTGLATWHSTDQDNQAPTQQLDIALQANVQALRVSNRSDRQLSLSGPLTATLKNNLLQLRGQLTADHAMVILPNETAPKLSDDVVVRPSASQTAATAVKIKAANPQPTASAASHPRITPDVHITLGLGPDFQLRGRGLVTRLAGQLELKSSESQPFSLVGSIRTRQGSYQAYGQRLDIEQGELRFFGPPDIAVLDILAIRPQISHRVGVQVLGSSLSPVVRLVADPELPEADKLAWLVLGRPAGGRGGEAALLQQAAMALLGGNDGVNSGLMQALGLDDLGFQGNASDTAAGTTIVLGKRVSKDIYVAYESGLAGSMGVFTIFYDLTKRLTLRAQTGEQSALDLIWTQRYD